MPTFFLCVVGVITGVIVAFALLIAVEGFSNIVHPFPADFNGTMEEMCLHVARYPDWVLAMVVPMWATIAFVCPAITRWIGNRGCASLVGLLLIVGAVCNVANLPYPTWFKVVILIVVPVAAVLGCGWPGRQRKPMSADLKDGTKHEA